MRSHAQTDIQRLLLIRASPRVLELLFVHPLRASSAVHLGSALRVASGRSQPLPFLTADRILAEVAAQEGLTVETFDD